MSEPAAPAISVADLEKRYGARRVLRGVSFELPAGEALLVTGPNGSGKTTLLRLLVGLQAPSRGVVRVAIERSRLGFLGHEPLLYRELTALENLDLYGRLYHVPGHRGRADALLERFGLAEAARARVSSFSRGMVQRLALCRVLLHEPSLLVLDEPYTALDADGARLLDGELARLATGRTLVLSTHDPARVADLASRRLALGSA